ncbi:MAG: COX15/CtaA family protein [Methylomonas sp.]|jgi:cytochrome c oxidase assembly protein subunit 15
MVNPLAVKHFRHLGVLCIFAVYTVIFAGSVVRASGAGMGCPDWPTCFGQWAPPVSEAQLPVNYHELYAARGYENTQFNPVKTWTEYTNRLIGASTGLLVMLTVWSSRVYLKSDKAVFYLSVLALVLIGAQGWLGSAVVASNLKPMMITLHMLLALLIVALLIYAVTRSQKELIYKLDCQWLQPGFMAVLKIAMLLTLTQFLMGTQVRESIDYIAHDHAYIDRQYWRESFPVIFYVHRSFSSLILLANLWLAWKIRRNSANNSLFRHMAYILAGLTVTAILAGVSLDRLGFPAVAQPIHLLMANLIFGSQFFIYASMNYANGNQRT